MCCVEIWLIWARRFLGIEKSDGFGKNSIDGCGAPQDEAKSTTRRAVCKKLVGVNGLL
jgi:hypothetical protein